MIDSDEAAACQYKKEDIVSRQGYQHFAPRQPSPYTHRSFLHFHFTSISLLYNAMRAVLALTLLGAQSCALAAINLRRMTFLELAGLEERQTITHYCGEGDTCAEACGAGYETCISYPTCYDAAAGDVCCSDGSKCRFESPCTDDADIAAAYCPAGTYCTDVACCDNGVSLEECGASMTLSTVAPSPTSVSSVSTETTSSTSTVYFTSTSSSASAASSSTTISYSSYSSTSPSASAYTASAFPTTSVSASAAIYSSLTSTSESSAVDTTATTSLPAQQTTNAGVRQRVHAIDLILGGLALLL